MMRLPKFRYFAPTSVKEALRIRAGEGEDASFVAGGTDLYPNMKRRQQTPKVVIGLARIAALRKLRADADGLAIGAAVPLSDIEHDRRVRREYRASRTRSPRSRRRRCATWARSAATSCSTRAATTTTRTTSGARRSTSA